jgi:hypothetical protein
LFDSVAILAQALGVAQPRTHDLFVPAIVAMSISGSAWAVDDDSSGEDVPPEPVPEIEQVPVAAPVLVTPRKRGRPHKVSIESALRARDAAGTLEETTDDPSTAATTTDITVPLRPDLLPMSQVQERLRKLLDVVGPQSGVGLLNMSSLGLVLDADRRRVAEDMHFVASLLRSSENDGISSVLSRVVP